MEDNSEKENSKNNISNIINNQNDSNIQNSENINDYPFQMITKEQEREDKKENKNEENIENKIEDKKEEKNEDKIDNKKEEEIQITKEQEKLKIDLQQIINHKPKEENINSEKKKTLINNILNSSEKPHLESIIESKNESNQKIRKKINLNFLSPEVYMKKKMVHTQKNINPLEIKLKKIEQEIQNQFDYDYKRIMQQMKDEFEVIKRNKQQQKHIKDEEEKLKEKLKSMEEYREKKLKERSQKIFKKQNKVNKNLKKIKLGNITNLNKDINNPSNSSKEYSKTLESTINKKLPPISTSTERCREIQEKKDQNEKEFILNTQEDLKNLELDHKENYLHQLNLVNKKIKAHNKLYEKRNEAYSKFREEKEKEKNENYLQKDIKRRYNVKLTILRNRSEKAGRLQEQIKKNLDNFHEKREILENKEKKKIKEYLKKLNKHNSASKSMINKGERRKYFSDLQKNNMSNVEKELEERYNDFLWNQEYIKNIAYDIQKVDSNKRKHLYENNLQMQNENEKKTQSFYDFLYQIKKNNIINKSDDAKLKIYKKKVRDEIEERNKKEEELLNK